MANRYRPGTWCRRLSRMTCNGTQHLPPPNLSDRSTFEQHVFSPPPDPHLAASAAFEQLTVLKSATSHVDLLCVRLALLSGAFTLTLARRSGQRLRGWRREA